MKKIIAVLILLVILLSGCTRTGKIESFSNESRFVQVEQKMFRWVVYDKYTKVMYVEKSYSFTPLYDADGCLLLWEGGNE